MNYKTCKAIYENFILDEKFNVHLAVRENGNVKKKVAITNPLEKGYVYANLYFYDEVQKEINKLLKLIRKIHEEVVTEISTQDPAILLLEMSTRARNTIGDDSLDALIKEELAKDTRHIALVSDAAEAEKLNAIYEAIFTELMTDFVNATFNKTTEKGNGFKSFQLTGNYVSTMTETQKKVFAPAIKMAGFMNGFKLEGFELMPDWTVKFKPGFLAEPFAAKEEEIKVSLKQLMEKELI